MLCAGCSGARSMQNADAGAQAAEGLFQGVSAVGGGALWCSSGGRQGRGAGEGGAPGALPVPPDH